jgi:arginyl-tRNA synthetase
MTHEPGESTVFSQVKGNEGHASLTAGNVLLHQNEALDVQVKQALTDKIQQVSAEVLPRTEDYFLARTFGSLLADIDRSGYDSSLTTVGPPVQKNELTKGIDIAFNVVGMARARSLSPQDVAIDIGAHVRSNEANSSVEVVGPFVNIELDHAQSALQIISEIEGLKNKYGHFRDDLDPKIVVIDYSSPNVAKNMTVAHLRSTIIGHSLVKIHEAAGDIPFGINHIGDWGTQFGNIIYQYKSELARRGDAFLVELEIDPTATLMRIYREFTANLPNDPNLADAGRAMFHKLEEGDPELVELWDKFRKWSLRDFGPAYTRLGVNFDAIQGESFYEDKMAPTVDDAIQKGVLRTNDDGAVVFPSQPLINHSGKPNNRIMLDQNGEPRDEIIVKPSGGTVYLTRDLAAIAYRSAELHADKVLYVIGKEQEPHTMELFAMATQMGYLTLGNLVHISFGHLNVEGRKMKSRAGKVVLLNDILDESQEAAMDMILKRKAERGDGTPLTAKEIITARQIGLSALIFNDLRQDRRRDIEFNPDMATNIEEGGSVYIQYTDARLTRVIEKVGQVGELTTIPAEISDDERSILLEMARLPFVIKEASEQNMPNKLATYLTDLCQSINAFYNEKPVVNAPTEEERIFRTHLLKAAKQVIENTSRLLHIELPGEM